MYCWDVNGSCGSSCTRGVASITWGLEKQSSYMLVKEQPATQARQDLVSTCGLIKLTQFGLYDFCLSSSGMSGLRF
jgi:predicted metal-dependent enzyme (double-stranded beta helix superfamily)